MKTVLVSVIAALCATMASATDVTLLHFSDYHAHALPFYSEGRADQGGIARAIGYLRRQHDRGAIVLSGGDMINKGSPAWSDKYRCVEWPWLNGIVEAMAYGNHDSDYGVDVFRECAKAISYPILSANVTDANGSARFARWTIVRRGGVRIGVFAVAGPDFEALVKADARPAAGARFTDATAAARDVVAYLRGTEGVDAVVMIGHEHRHDDFALAEQVPGVDVIFGTHSHRKDELQRIPGTTTWFLSPFQYLAYISRVVLTFDGHRLTGVRGNLVRVDDRLPVDRRTAVRVTELQRELERDPAYTDLFRPIGASKKTIGVAALGSMAVELMRERTGADIALSTKSSFRQAIPAGTVTMEALRSALPYDNEIVVAELSGAAVQKLLETARSGADGGAFWSGEQAVDPSKRYRVATTDYLARVAAAYRDAFAGAVINATGMRVRNELRNALSSR